MTDRDLLYHVQDIQHANPLPGGNAILRLRARRGEVEGCALLLDGHADPLPMQRIESTPHHDLYEARVAVPAEGISYNFAVDLHGERVCFTKYGTFREPIHFGAWSLAVAAEDVFVTPDWVKDAVFYQIFPERFRNGDKSNDPPNVEPWDAIPRNRSFFGGDLQGVLDKLDYLKELGVNAIYFNPIFEASTNHKYNTTDYFKVDPHFGDTPLLRRLVSEAHARGMRVILDGVFNHVGTDFAPFQDVVRKGRKSKYVDWFFIKSFPVEMHPKPTYACWWNIWELPKLNTNNPEVRKYLLNVATHWSREVDIDGWRLDVPEEVPMAFWREFRKTVKAARPDAYIVGEIWHDGRPWLRGDQFDAVMNYPLREAILALLGARTRDGEAGAPALGSVKAYHRAMHELLTDLPEQVVQAQFNLLGSHDTERMRTLLGGNERKVRLATTLLMTAPGAPVVYYGDEVGMEGGKDPDCRRGFPWDGPRDLELQAFFKRVIGLRHQHAALRTGSYRSVLVDEKANTYAFLREKGGHALLVAVNPNDTLRTIDAPAPGARSSARDLLDALPVTLHARFEGMRVSMTLPPYGAAIVELY